ncbi:hypothetical protein CEXT_684761 [Caerostris extrusa]|uniref:Uncharacterized protein n=1 Tax=Caerostris extrusa TaxID=172846 RepID=A0AAV4MBJ4_CAEEX|nr:hypothetical protein CEXT_684761 [Caerostris extrusa]
MQQRKDNYSNLENSKKLESALWEEFDDVREEPSYIRFELNNWYWYCAVVKFNFLWNYFIFFDDRVCAKLSNSAGFKQSNFVD